MKRALVIMLSVVVVFIVLIGGMRLMGPKIGNTFSTISASLPGDYGGGAPDVLQSSSTGSRFALPGAPAPAFDSVTNEEYDASNSPVQPAQERLVIQNVDLTLVVKDPKARMAEIADMAKEMGGFVVVSNSYQDTSTGRGIPHANITIRVPSERLDDALAKIKKDAVDVPYENRTGEDVTSMYVDLQSQLKAKEAAEKQLLEIMEEATQAKDVLAIYLEVQNVQTQIEQLKGQIKYYAESAAMSLITVSLVAEEGTQPLEVGPWTLEGTAKDAIQDLIRFVQGFAEFLTRFVLYILPSLILIAIPLFLIYLAGRAVYRRFNKPQVAVEDKHEERKG